MESKIHVQLRLSRDPHITFNLTSRYCGSSSIDGFCMDVVKDWVHILGSGCEVSVPVQGRVLKSRPVLEVPKCSDTHVFVVFPLTSNSDCSLTHRVYGIEVDGHHCITNEDITKKLSQAFDLPSIQQLVLDEATNCFVENLQQPQSYDTIDENRRFGAGSLFRAQLPGYEYQVVPSSPSPLSNGGEYNHAWNPCFNPLQESVVGESANAAQVPNENIVVPVSQTTPPLATLPVVNSFRDGPVALQMPSVSQVPDTLRMWEKSAGDTALQRVGLLDTMPSTGQHALLSRLQPQTPTVSDSPILEHKFQVHAQEVDVPVEPQGGTHPQDFETLAEVLRNESASVQEEVTNAESPAEEVPESESPNINHWENENQELVKPVEEESPSASSVHSRSSSSKEAPVANSKDQQALCHGNLLIPTKGMVAGMESKIPKSGSRSEPPSITNASPQEISHNPSRRASDPAPSYLNDQFGGMHHMIPIQRQISAEGEPVLIGNKPLPQQQTLVLSLQTHQSPNRVEVEKPEQQNKNEEEKKPTYTLPKPSVSQYGDEAKDVHVLEHVCKNRCPLEDCCNVLCDCQRVQRMTEELSAYHKKGVASEELKKLIRKHAANCKDETCHVPHLAAGCPLPTSQTSFTPTPTSSTYSRYTTTSKMPTSSIQPKLMQPSRHLQCLDLSFDPVPANCSTTQSMQARPSPVGAPGVAACEDDQGHDLVNHMMGLRGQQCGNYPDLPYPCYGQSHFPGSQKRPPLRFPQTYLPSPVVKYPPIYQHLGTRGVGYLESKHDQYDPKMREYSFLEPANLHLRRTQLPTDVQSHHFQSYSCYSRIARGTIIYSSDEMFALTQLPEGAFIPMPEITRVRPSDILGSGGNGTTFRHVCMGEEFAVKWTCYRSVELNHWYRFHHRNIVPLYAVIMDTGYKCFQLMPRMTTSLNKVLRSVGDLTSVWMSVDRKEWENVVMPNVQHILRSIILALVYLHERNVQHCDIKAGNVLIKKMCQCPDILHCTCPSKGKCLVQITDFDSAKAKSITHNQSGIPELQCVPKTPDECSKVMGTPGYRAPEQFVKPVPGALCSHATVMDQEGPWCDIWSFGMLVLQMYLGTNKAERKQRANILHYQPNKKDLSPRVEASHAREKLLDLCSSEKDCLQMAGQFVKPCLEPDFRKRPSAKEVLEHRFFKGY